jgi:hypothetical protein
MRISSQNINIMIESRRMIWTEDISSMVENIINKYIYINIVYRNLRTQQMSVLVLCCVRRFLYTILIDTRATGCITQYLNIYVYIYVCRILARNQKERGHKEDLRVGGNLIL